VHPKRLDRNAEFDLEGRGVETPLAYEGLRLAATPPADPPRKDDEKISLFWRVFGGTIFSIVALVVITLYNQLTGSINELRAELNKVNEARADLVKKEEFNARSTTMWNRVQELQGIHVVNTTLKAELERQAEKVTGLLAENRDQKIQIEKLRLDLTDLTNVANNRKDSRDRQMTQLEAERKEQQKLVQDLRERLAKLEGQQDRKPAKPPMLPPDNDPCEAH
jgi:hypothetical protein